MYCVGDWTYDLFLEDAKVYRAMPRKGVYPRRDAEMRELFMVWLKNAVRDFRAEWRDAGRKDYDQRRGWIGDAFILKLERSGFSDFYNEAYGQRPHLKTWYYVNAMELPSSLDTICSFCARPIEDAVENAKRMREKIRED